jgi:hypothetical protein
MNLAETFGGIAVAIMMHRTDFHKALDAQHEALARMTEPLQKLEQVKDRLHKLSAGDTLRKSASAYLEESNRLEREALAILHLLAAPLAACNAATDRAKQAMPAFEKWALGQHAKPSYTTMIAEKGGALASFRKQKSAPRDVTTAEVLDTMQRHRPDGGNQ